MSLIHSASPSATNIARLTREQLAEVRVAILSMAIDCPKNSDLFPKVKSIEKSLAKVFRGINSLLQMVNEVRTN